MKDHPAESEYKLPIRDSGEIIVSKAALASARLRSGVTVAMGGRFQSGFHKIFSGNSGWGIKSMADCFRLKEKADMR